MRRDGRERRHSNAEVVVRARDHIVQCCKDCGVASGQHPEAADDLLLHLPILLRRQPLSEPRCHRLSRRLARQLRQSIPRLQPDLKARIVEPRLHRGQRVSSERFIRPEIQLAQRPDAGSAQRFVR